MTIQELQQQMEDRQDKVAALERSKSSAIIDIEGLEAERRKLIVPARAGNNKAAQDRIALLDENLAKARRDMQDDDAAMTTLNEEIEGLRAQITEAEEAERRKQIGKRAKASAERARETVKRVHELIAATKQSLDDAAALGRDLDLSLQVSALGSFLVDLQGSNVDLRRVSPLAQMEQLAQRLGNFAAQF